jgi:sugar phosphate isomerase/epimerase
MDAAGLIRRAQELGLHVVQIADNIPLHQADSKQISVIRDVADRAGIELELGLRGLSERKIEEYIQLCGACNSRTLRAVIDAPGYEPPPAEVVRVVRAIVPRLRDAGVTLALENHDRFRARVLSAIISEIADAHVGICLDTANSFGALEGPEQIVETLGPQTVSLHIKDFIVVREPHQMGFRISGAPAGKGMLDVRCLLERLGSLGATGTVILELWPPPESTLEETAAKEKRWCEESIRYLRTLIAD